VSSTSSEPSTLRSPSIHSETPSPPSLTSPFAQEDFEEKWRCPSEHINSIRTKSCYLCGKRRPRVKKTAEPEEPSNSIRHSGNGRIEMAENASFSETDMTEEIQGWHCVNQHFNPSSSKSCLRCGKRRPRGLSKLHAESKSISSSETSKVAPSQTSFQDTSKGWHCTNNHFNASGRSCLLCGKRRPKESEPN